MKPVGKTTLYRMQKTAHAEQERLELIEKAPDYVIEKRDDFAGIVKLVGAVLSSKEIIELLKHHMAVNEMLATDATAAKPEAADA